MVIEYFKNIRKLIDLLQDENFDCVLGVVRGGYIPSEAISRFYGKDLCLIRISSYNESSRGDITNHGVIGKPHGRVLIVDDLVDSGCSLKYVCEYVESLGLSYKTAVIWNKVDESRDVQPDYFVLNVPLGEWIIQPMEQLFER